MAKQSSYVLADANREDLSDMIFNVDPSEVPILSAMKKKKASNTNHEWTEDALAAPSATNAAVEGADMGTPADDGTTRLGNYTQILTKDAIVTGTQEFGVNRVGSGKEMARQMVKKMKEIKTDWEMSAIGANNAKAAGNASTAREMGSVQTYLITNTLAGVGGSDGAGNGAAARTDGTQRDLTETILTAGLQLCFDSGANPKLAVCGSHVKGVISTFTGGGTRYVDTDNKKLVNSIDVYVGDFHTLKVVPSRHVRARDLLLIDPEYIACADLRAASASKIAPTGDAVKRQIVWESTLEVCTEKAHAGIYDLSTS